MEGVVRPLRPFAPWWPPLSGEKLWVSLRWLCIYRPGALWPDGLYEARRGGRDKRCELARSRARRGVAPAS
eukprot:204026-Pyramimonas_sp.AAC.1